MKILNLGCGTKTSPSPEVINIDWSIYFRIKKSIVLTYLTKPFVKGGRLKRLRNLRGTILAHDLRKGIPFPPDSIDVVYHSHFLEHLDREDARKFLIEVRRVLKPNGIHRIVIPDLEKLCRRYVAHIEICLNKTNTQEAARHDAYVADIVEQMVRREEYSTSQQPPLRRFVENLILGDSRRRGGTHQWMYDRINLAYLLKEVGFRCISFHRYDSSNIPHWNKYALDVDEWSNEYKPESFYVESFK